MKNVKEVLGGIVTNYRERKALREEREAMREMADAHYERHYGEQDMSMTRLDWVKAILGGVCTALFFWAFTAFVFIL